MKFKPMTAKGKTAMVDTYRVCQLMGESYDVPPAKLYRLIKLGCTPRELDRLLRMQQLGASPKLLRDWIDMMANRIKKEER